MRSRIIITVAASLTLLLAEGAPAQAPAAPTPQTVTDDQAINIIAQKLCHTEPVVGTRIAFKRKCNTPAQVEQYRQQARQILEDYRHRPCVMGTGAGPNDTPMQC